MPPKVCLWHESFGLHVVQETYDAALYGALHAMPGINNL